MVVTVVTVELP
jgi:hypothetical protein